MDGCIFLLFAFLSGFCLCPLPSLSLHKPGSEGLITGHFDGGIHEQSSNENRLLLQFRELQAVKPEAKNEEGSDKNGNREGTNTSSSESGSAMDANLPADIGPKGTTNNATTTVIEDSHSNMTNVPPPPPTLAREEEKHLPNDKTETEFNDTNLDTNTQISGENCGGSHCKDPNKMVSACLSIPGEGTHKLSLFITYEGETSVQVKIVAPDFLIAERAEVLVSKGKSETIHFSMDLNHDEASLKSGAIQGKSISITSVHGACEVAVPTDYLLNSMKDTQPQFSSFLPMMEPRELAYVLVLVLMVSFVGAWLCFKCHGKKRGEDVKYQQLEMNGLGQGMPKESNEQGNGSADGWDEVWDDDWEDIEAAKSSSRLSQSLSSRGLAARRGTKDGWDTSWED